MIPLGSDRETLYTGWLRQKHPRTWAHYFAWVRALRRAVAGRDVASTAELEIWLSSRHGETRRAARKGIRKYLQWLASCKVDVSPLQLLAKHTPVR